MRTLLLVLVLAGPASAQVSYQRILDASSEPENWFTYSGTYAAQRYSTLDQINRDNRQVMLRRLTSGPDAPSGIIDVLFLRAS